MKIEDYALVGDCHSAALVGRDGSIDWLCWPRFDSPACFAALLGRSEHGRWKIAPAQKQFRVSRRYREDTLILETVFETASGAATLIDFMPMRDEHCNLVRIVSGTRGQVALDLEFILRFDYGASVPWVTRLENGGGIRAIAGPDMATLHSPVPLQGKGLSTVARFEIAAGERKAFVLAHGASHAGMPPPLDAEAALERTARFWRDWSSRCRPADEWSGAVKRSLITLKALTYAPTGGVVAAPSTSLPEFIGGVRNWDYRFCWLRDATLTLLGRRVAGATGWCARWPARRSRSRSCTASRVSGVCPRPSCPGFPATKARPRCASATPPPASCSSTSTAK